MVKDENDKPLFDAVGSAAAAQTAAEGYADSLVKDENDKPLFDAVGSAAAAQTAAEGYADGLNTAMNTRVEALEAIDHDHSNKNVLDGITADKVTAWDKGQANVIEKIIFNGEEVVIDNQTKTATLNTPEDYITGLAEGEKVLSVVEGKLSSTLGLNYYKGKGEDSGKYEIQLVGKDNEVLGRVDAKDFIKDGMLHTVELKENPEGQTEGTYLVFTWNNESGVTAPMYVPVTSLMDVYNAGNGLDLNGKTFSISLKANEKYLEVSENGLATKGIDDAITTAKNALLGADGDASSVGTIYGAKKYADEKADAAYTAAISAAAEDATTKANAAQAAAAEDATTKANAAQAAAEKVATDLNTAMNTRVEALEAIDHDHSNKNVLDGISADKVAAWDAAEQNAKDYANNTFVSKEGFNEFETKYEEKLNAIENNAQVNVIESVKVNGITANITNKEAEVSLKAKDVQLGAAITSDGQPDNGKEGDESNVVYGEGTYVPTVLQGIYSAIRSAVAGGVNSVTAGDESISVDSADANNPKVRVNVESVTDDTVAAGHIGLIAGPNGLYAEMYYDGDDIE